MDFDRLECAGPTCRRKFTQTRYLSRHEDICPDRIRHSEQLASAIRKRRRESGAASGSSIQGSSLGLPQAADSRVSEQIATRRPLSSFQVFGLERGPAKRPRRQSVQEETTTQPRNDRDVDSESVDMIQEQIPMPIGNDSLNNQDHPLASSSYAGLDQIGASDDNHETVTHQASPHPSPSPQPEPVPTTRIRVPTARALAMMADDLPDGPGALLDDPTLELHEPEPVAPLVEQLPTAAATVAPPASLRIRIRRLFRTARNKFGVSRLYRGQPSAIPNITLSGHHLFADDVRLPSSSANGSKPASVRTVEEIIHPYPNFSSFLFNRWFWNGSKKTKKSREELMEDVFAHPEFHLEDVKKNINFDSLDEKISQQSEGMSSANKNNGWKTSVVRILIPTGKKRTKATVRAENAARQRRHAGVDSEFSDNSENEAVRGTRYAGRPFNVPDFHHKSLTNVIKETFSSSEAKNFHWHPFEEDWETPWGSVETDDTNHERVHCDVSGGKFFVNADRDLQDLPKETGCDLPRAVAGLMFYSDATRVAQFGQAKLWPVYMYFANQSKYDRARPEKRGGHTVAFLPSIPDTIADYIFKDPSGKINPPLLAHCRRDLFHGCWMIILTEDEFLYAYAHGIIIDCGDGIRRRIYPRIFIYSADYPEKVLVATIRDLGKCPCPRCTIPKVRFIDLGTAEDMAERVTLARVSTQEQQQKVLDARSLIYDDGLAVTNTQVEALLKGDSLVPTENAFVACLGCFNFDIHRILVVDLMHEVELGVWKSLLQHLIRMLHCVGQPAVHEFNARFRQVAPFGRETIRKFSTNVSELSQLAARNYEDILQCCIPCFEGLFPEPHNRTILDLLYLMGYWHSLAKLRMHTDTSLRVLREVTGHMADALRYFANETCGHFDTVELDTEYQARNRLVGKRQAKIASSRITSGLSGIQSSNIILTVHVEQIVPPAPIPVDPTLATTPNPTPMSANLSDPPTVAMDVVTTATVNPFQHGAAGGKRKKTFNMATPKAHALADYAHHIEWFGTTDGFSSVVGESRHRVLKGQNNRTNFNNPIPQIIKIDTRELVHDRMTRELNDRDSALTSPHTQTPQAPSQEDMITSYHISSKDERNKIFISNFVKEHNDDPAFRDFIPRLQAHLLARKEGKTPFSEDEANYSDLQLSQVIFRDSLFFTHATARFNYTGYDVRRDQDSINANTDRRDVMVPSFEESYDENGVPTHPHWYARVLGIYHANIHYKNSPVPECVEFLWVRWFGQDTQWKGGPSTLNLDRIGFVPSRDPDSFGFLDPSLVIRACHLIPAFHVGRTFRLLAPSAVRDSPAEGDWANYYVMRFSDRDLMMRHLGTGVGHRQSKDFPREDEALKASLSGDSYVVSEPAQTSNPLSDNPVNNPQNFTEGIQDEEVPETEENPVSESDSGDGEDEDEFTEEMYDL